MLHIVTHIHHVVHNKITLNSLEPAFQMQWGLLIYTAPYNATRAHCNPQHTRTHMRHLMFVVLVICCLFVVDCKYTNIMHVCWICYWFGNTTASTSCVVHGGVVVGSHNKNENHVCFCVCHLWTIVTSQQRIHDQTDAVLQLMWMHTYFAGQQYAYSKDSIRVQI